MRSDSASTNFKLAVCLAGVAGSSVGKESICNAGDPGLIPGLGRSTGEGVGYLLQHSWASLVVQLVNNPPAVWKTWVQSLGGRVGGLERYLGEGDGYPLQYSGLENSESSKELDTTEQLSLSVCLAVLIATSILDTQINLFIFWLLFFFFPVKHMDLVC